MLVSNAPQSGADRVLDAVLFDVGGRSVRRRLVREWARAFHAAFAARLSERARLGAGVVDDEEAVEALVDAEAAEFRYGRELESSDDLLAWLDARGLTVDGWWESLRRTVLERRAADGRDVLAPVDPEAATNDEEEVLRADLAITDLLTDATEALASRLAVALETRQWTLPSADESGADVAMLASSFHELEDIWTPWLDAARTESALQAAVDRERLGWVVLELVETTWPTEDAAREAMSCVRYDGMTLESLAEEAGATARPAAVLLSALPEALHDALLVAAPGELVGPVGVGARWFVMHVAAKRAPTLAEPLVREAARRAVESRAAAAAVARHVTWREFRP
jgi:hypothetical protein